MRLLLLEDAVPQEAVTPRILRAKQGSRKLYLEVENTVACSYTPTKGLAFDAVRLSRDSIHLFQEERHESAV